MELTGKQMQSLVEKIDEMSEGEVRSYIRSRIRHTNALVDVVKAKCYVYGLALEIVEQRDRFMSHTLTYRVVGRDDNLRDFVASMKRTFNTD